ncbi:MAG: hypothetical protein MJZ25_16625 [Fibrobacter sp.]|nr:hypothetical protein [Fibrobacter sp.]
MKEKGNGYVKRTQKDYSMSFKMSVVKEVETTDIGLCAIARKYGIQSETTVKRWMEKYGTFDWTNIKGGKMPKSKEQELLELKEKIKQLERKNARLEHELEMKDHKVAIFDLMIDIAEKDLKVDIRKNMLPGQSKNTSK